MTAPRGAALYSPALLALAVELAHYPYDAKAQLTGHARSRTCGSTVDISLAGGEVITHPGLKVTACAVGQAAAAIFARGSAGKSRDDCAATLSGLRDWLSGVGGLPGWPGLEALVAAREYPGRHEAILLPWRAAMDALCKEVPGG